MTRAMLAEQALDVAKSQGEPYSEYPRAAAEEPKHHQARASFRGDRMSRIRRRTDRAERLRRGPRPISSGRWRARAPGLAKAPGCAGRSAGTAGTEGSGGSFGAFFLITAGYAESCLVPAMLRRASCCRPRRRISAAACALSRMAWPERPPARSGLRHVRVAARWGEQRGLAVRALTSCRGELTRPGLASRPLCRS